MDDDVQLFTYLQKRCEVTTPCAEIIPEIEIDKSV